MNVLRSRPQPRAAPTTTESVSSVAAEMGMRDPRRNPPQDGDAYETGTYSSSTASNFDGELPSAATAPRQRREREEEEEEK